MDPSLTRRSDPIVQVPQGGLSPVVLPATTGALHIFTEVTVKNHFGQSLSWLVPYLIDFTWRAIAASPLGVMHPSQGTERIYGLCEIFSTYHAVRAEQEQAPYEYALSPETWSRFHYELAENVLECLSRGEPPGVAESADEMILRALPLSPPDFLALELQRASRAEVAAKPLGPAELKRLAYEPEALIDVARAVRRHFLSATR